MKTYDFDAMIFAIVLSVLGGLIVGVFLRGRIGKLKADGDRTWRTQDWIWLLCFLLYAQVFTVLYKDMVLGVVSYVSTFVSIALGAVAIYISVREATKGDKVKDQINIMLGEMREKLTQKDIKLDNFDPKEFNTYKDVTIDSIIEAANKSLKDNIEKAITNAEPVDKKDIVDKVKVQLEQASNELKSSLNVSIEQDNTRVFSSHTAILGGLITDLLKEEGKALSALEIQNLLRKNGISILGNNLLKQVLYKLTTLGDINVSKDGEYYLR